MITLEDGDEAGVGDIADACGVRPDTVNKWIARHPSFPAARNLMRGRVWQWGEVRQWLRDTGRPVPAGSRADVGPRVPAAPDASALRAEAARLAARLAEIAGELEKSGGVPLSGDESQALVG